MLRLVLLAVLLTACGDNPMPLFGNSPWHMWGTEQVIIVTPTTGAVQPVAVSSQLARINYKRPETWHFFIYAELMDPAVANDDLLITCNVNLMFGIGRSVFDSQGQPAPGFGMPTAQRFVQFQWVRGLGASLPNGSRKWTTKATTPPLIDGTATSTHVIDSFVAEDIQASASCVAAVVGNSPPVTIRVGAFFAPKTHVRADWFVDDEKVLNERRFRGDETGGS